ncbi:PAS domain-containing protein [Pseudopedobacter beijingensis]|uniref:histidine kinase n=1 Tax=Pseudopedobacter beijingensis TaxID=1207056 RepID=A0ABW4IE83_9SPHI
MQHSEFYYSLLDRLSIVAVTDRSGRIIHANDKFCEISKYSREELIGNTHSIINSKYHPKSFFIDLWKTISSGKVWRGEIRNRAKDGEIYWVDTFIVPKPDENNKIESYYSIRIDITEKKLKELEVIQQKDDLEEIAQMQSHQVRRPVANIIGLMHLFDESKLSDDNEELFQKMKESVEELEITIRDIVEKAH